MVSTSANDSYQRIHLGFWYPTVKIANQASEYDKYTRDRDVTAETSQCKYQCKAREKNATGAKRGKTCNGC